MDSLKSKKTIKFGILSDSLLLKSWQVECINKVLDLKNTSLELIILPTKEINKKTFALFRTIKNLRIFPHALFYIYKKLFFNPKCNFHINLLDEFSGIDKIHWIKNEKNRKNSAFSYEDKEKIIIRKDLDFIISFSETVDFLNEIIDLPKYGIWAYHHDDEQKYRGNVHCFWEIYHDDNVTGAILKRINSDRIKYIVLKEGYFKTFSYSYKRNFANVHSLSTGWVKQVCIDLINNNASYLNNLPIESKARYYNEPSNFEFIKFYYKLLKNRILKLYKNLFLVEQWNVGLINKSLNDFLKNSQETKINWLFSPPKGTSYADPFLIKEKDEIHLLFESFNIKEKKGMISSAILRSFTNIDDEIKICMEKSFHVSYPHVFNYKDETFLIPESSRAKEIALYKAIEFPFVWEKVAVFVEDLYAADPTIFEHDGFWWLTCTVWNNGWNHSLLVFYSDDLFGPWYPHKKNPVKMDIRSSRPAGKIYKFKGLLIRPAQDCSKAYGRSIVLNKIVKLTPYEFAEESYKFISPYKNTIYRKGIHTINSLDNMVIIDGRRDVFNPIKFMYKNKKASIPQDIFKKNV